MDSPATLLGTRHSQAELRNMYVVQDRKKTVQAQGSGSSWGKDGPRLRPFAARAAAAVVIEWGGGGELGWWWGGAGFEHYFPSNSLIMSVLPHGWF